MIKQMIALAIESDTDLRNYRLSCHYANDAADGDQGSFWRQRFLARYDPVSSAYRISNVVYKKCYLRRQHGLAVCADPQKKGKLRFGHSCIQIIRDLVAESFTPSKATQQPMSTSKNMEIIHTFVAKYGLLKRSLEVLRSGGDRATDLELLYAVQLCLTHVFLNGPSGSLAGVAKDFPESQQMAYATAVTEPIFDMTGKVNLRWTFHIANFFNFHLKKPTEHLAGLYAGLSDCDRPQCWSKPLQDGPQKLGKYWKGSYTFVEHNEIVAIRARNNVDDLIQDQTPGEEDDEGFQTLRLDFPQDKNQPWPADFEQILRARSAPIQRGKTRAQARGVGSGGAPQGEPLAIRFQGTGNDASAPFLASGWLNPLPPQQGIPGWQRLTMMKYYVNDEDETSPVAALRDSLWAYEGVVLPGGMIVLGRWWHPVPGRRDEYSGPFILWNVDASEVETDKEEVDG